MALGRGEGRTAWTIAPRQLIWKFSDRARQRRERQTLTPQAALGRRGEDLAHRFLRNCGYFVVGRNYRPGPDSEIDIVARQGDTLVFVEVKSRSSAEFGSPDRAIDGEKQKKIIRAARTFVTRAGASWSQVRFDTIAIVFNEPPSLTHYQDVFFDGRAIDPA